MRWLYLLPIFALSGCGKVTDQDLAKRLETIALQPIEQQALSTPCFEPGDFPEIAWWEMFGDPQLNHLVIEAEENNPTLQQAFAKVALADQEARRVRATLIPSLGAEYAENWQYFSKNGFVRSFYPIGSGVAIPPKINQIDLSLSFNYELDFFGRNRHRFQGAIDEARSMRAEAEMARLLITTLVCQTYVELQMKRLQKDLVLGKIAVANKRLELSAKKFDAGLDAIFSPLDKEAHVYSLEQTLFSLEKQIALDEHMLAFLVGKNAGEVVIESPMQVELNQLIALPKDLSSDLLARRPDLSAQIWRVEAAAEQIGAAKADFYPRVNLMALAGLEGLNFNQLFHLSSKQGAVDPAIHLPIFTGGALTANLKKQVALFNEETYKYNEMVLQAVQEVADDVSTLIATFETLNYQKANVEILQLEWELQKKRQSSGLDSLLTVLEREEELLSEESLFVEAQRNYLLGVIKLIKALGGGYSET